MRLGWLAAVAVLGLVIGPAAARAGDQTTQYLVDPQHSNAVPHSPLQPPLRLRWEANIGEVASNVVVTGGRVFYVRGTWPEQEITALRASDGAVLWSRTWMAKTRGWNGLAFDGGRLFWVRNHNEDPPFEDLPDDVHVEAIEPATGATIWNRNLPARYGVGSHPTAADGELYFLADEPGAGLYALRQSDGADRWPPKDLSGGDSSTPTLDGSNVYVSLAGAQTYAFDRASGALRWHHAGCCSGAGGTTTRVIGDRLYAHDGHIHDTSDGRVVGSWFAGGMPAWSAAGGVAERYPLGLRGFGPSYEATRWELGTDVLGYLSTPLIAGSYAYTSSPTGLGYELLALRLGDGRRVWCLETFEPPGVPSDLPPAYPVAAGHGLLFVNTGWALAAYESGGDPSDCAAAPDEQPGATPPRERGPALRLEVARRKLLVGRRIKVVGRLSALPNPGRRTIVLDVDPWPFDGRFTPAARGRTASDGAVAFRYAPRRNVRLRARLIGDPRLASRPVKVYADLPMAVRKRDAGGRRPRLQVRLEAARSAAVRRRTVYGYLARGTRPWRRAARGRWKLAARTATVTLRYPRGRLRASDRWLVCTRETKPDPFGRPRAIDRLCGRRTLPR